MAMDFEISNQQAYDMLEFQADSVGVSLSSVCRCEFDDISVVPVAVESQPDLHFSVSVKEQNLFRIKEFFYLMDLLFSVSSDLFSQKNTAHVSAKQLSERRTKLRRFYTSPHALYKAVRRIRL
jgi:hypothetical protein